MTRAERVGLARREHDVGLGHGVESDLGIALAASSNTFATPRCASTDEPYVSPFMVIQGRRQIGMKARVWIDTGDGSGSGSYVRSTEQGERLHLRRDVRNGRRRGTTCTRSPRASSASTSSLRFSSSLTTTRSGAIVAICVDVRVLRASDVGQLGMFAEARHRDRRDVPREQGLSDGRDEADDAHCDDNP